MAGSWLRGPFRLQSPGTDPNAGWTGPAPALLSMNAILAFVDHFLPGFKAGGPIRTLANIIDRLGNEFEFRIVTRDRDWTDRAPYPDVQVDAWQRVGNAEVFYASPASLRGGTLRRLLSETEHGAVYVNSLFSPRFTGLVVTLRALHFVPRN